jgi:hypothetical protein
MGFLRSLFTACTAPSGSSAYVISRKTGGTLYRVIERKNGTFELFWNRGFYTLNGSCLFWMTLADAEEFATAHGIDLSEIEIDWAQVTK